MRFIKTLKILILFLFIATLQEGVMAVSDSTISTPSDQGDDTTSAAQTLLQILGSLEESVTTEEGLVPGENDACKNIGKIKKEVGKSLCGLFIKKGCALSCEKICNYAERTCKDDCKNVPQKYVAACKTGCKAYDEKTCGDYCKCEQQICQCSPSPQSKK